MTARKRVESLDRPTTTRDWIGAKVRIPGEKRSSKLNGKKFYIFRAHGMRLVFAVTNGDKPPARAGLGRSVDWELIKTIDESGEKRVGFEEAEAKKAIAKKGYLLVKMPTAQRSVAKHSH
jgi:hypothetical protein